MSRLILIGTDGSEGARRALEFAQTMAVAGADALLIAHVIEWSPYSFLTPQEIAERHQRRKEELTRAEVALTRPWVEELRQLGLEASSEIRYGNISKSLCKLAKERGATQLIIGRDGENSLTDRLFGTVASTLVQTSPVPVTVVP